MLDGSPWPLDANGQPIHGVTVLLILVNYRGVPAGVCIESSSGSDVLDTSAIRRLTTRLFVPEMKYGFPATSYVRVPVAFGMPEGSVGPLSAFSPARECIPRPVPGITQAELRLSESPVVKISPVSGMVPGTNSPWPMDEHGHPVTLTGYASVLVDASGRAVTVETLKPGIYPAFSAFASQSLAAMTFVGSGEQHWENVAFHFNAGSGTEPPH